MIKPDLFKLCRSTKIYRNSLWTAYASIHQICLVQTSICFQNSKRFWLNNNLCAMKKPSKRSMTILKALKETTSRKESGAWRNVGSSTLNFAVIMLKNKVRHKTQIVIFISNQVIYQTGLVTAYQTKKFLFIYLFIAFKYQIIRFIISRLH